MEGFSAYYEVCTNLRFNNWTSVWDNVSMVPYAFQDTHWSSYENLQSIRAKAAYAKANRLGGLWFYDISTDDFNGTFCGNGTFPLIRAAKSTFENTSIPITTTARPTTTTTLRRTTTTTLRPTTTTTLRPTTTPLPTKVIRPFTQPPATQ